MNAHPKGWPFPNPDWQETALPNEQELFEAFAREIVGHQKEDASKDGRPFRGFHAKTHAGLIAEFQVLGDLPDYARHGVFAVPQTFPAVVRFSNGDSRIKRDGRHEPRGIAIKLIGVKGRKLLPGQQDAVTQDFLATSHSVTSTVRDIRQFIAFGRAEREGSMIGLLPRLLRAFGWKEGWRITGALIRNVLLSKVRSMATEEYSGTAPIKCGPYAMKFTVRPAEGTPAAKNYSSADDDFLRKELADRLRTTDLVMDFLAQFYVDRTRTPIEDTSVPWEVADAPLLKVAQLRIPRCDLDDQRIRARSAAIDRLSFSPWHATDDHRPLGNVMRARRVAYEMSAAFRTHDPEPTSLPL